MKGKYIVYTGTMAPSKQVDSEVKMLKAGMRGRRTTLCHGRAHTQNPGQKVPW